MYQRASAGGGGSDWYNVILLTTAPGAAITITDGDEEIEATGTGSQQAIAIHDESATYTISVVVNGFTKPGTSVSTGTTSGVIFEREVAFAEVTLTYDDDFRSETGTISDGTTTANYTFPASDNETTIYIPSTGTWNVYCTVSGEQYKSSDIVVTSLSDSYTSNIHVRPNGKTVTPTDDIQTWLECGGIKGRSYTTLDEVLADHETLQKLISDENAVDYMLRSKTWIKQEALVPAMTSNTTPEGNVYAYGTYSSTYPAYQAFDSNLASGWAGPDDGDTTAWICYKFAAPKIVRKARITYGTANDSRKFNAFSIQGSNNTTNGQDGTWTDLTPTNLSTRLLSSGYDEFEVDCNGVEYQAYRVYVTSKTGIATVYGLQFYSLADHGITEDETAMRYIGKRNYAADTLLADSNPGLVPVMTDNTHPSGEAFASSEHSTTYYPAWKSFDGLLKDPADTSDSPRDDTWLPDDNATTPYVGYDFGTPTLIKCLKIVMGKIGTGYDGITYSLKGSNDSKTGPWTDIATLGTTSDGTHIHDVNVATAYRYYSIHFDGTISSSSRYTTIPCIQFYAKSLSESMWDEAIVNSDYYASVFNKDVPQQASGSTDCFATASYSGYPTYQAFDKNNATGWMCTYNTWPHVIGYKFDTPVKVKMIASLCLTSSRYATEFVVQGSNDSTTGLDGTWADLTPGYSQSGVNNAVDRFVVDTKGVAYRWYRLKVYRCNVQQYAEFFPELNFLAREDVDETKIDIYGAAGAAVSYKNGNSWSPLTTLENDGHKQIAKSSLPAGVSQLEMKTDVAKDPDDLAADFTKKVNIFDSMIEMMLMPENALYWYGFEADGLEDCTADNGWTTSATYGTNAPTRNTTYLTMSTSGNSDKGVGTKNIIKSAGKVNAIAKGTSQVSGTDHFGDITASVGSKIVHGSSVTDFLDLKETGSVKKFTKDVSSLSNFYSSIWTTYGGVMDVYGFWIAKPNPASNFFSAAKDTVYYTQGGVDIVVAETDELGGAIVDLTKIPDGVTLHSTIADDPDDLTAKYSKVYHEPVSGKFYLMPDNALYWYGWDVGFDRTLTWYYGSSPSSLDFIHDTNKLNASGLNYSAMRDTAFNGKFVKKNKLKMLYSKTDVKQPVLTIDNSVNNKWVAGEDAYIGICVAKGSAGDSGRIYFYVGFDIQSGRNYFSNGYFYKILNEQPSTTTVDVYAIWQED